MFNEGYHWALGDFMTGTTDQGGRSVQDAKPVGYFFRAGPGLGGSSGVGGLYDVLGPSSHSVEDASFMKLREVSLTYNVGTIGGQGNWTVGLVGRNLLTISDYRGYDPESATAAAAQIAALNGVDTSLPETCARSPLQLSTSF